jgi:hypothetical protein
MAMPEVKFENFRMQFDLEYYSEDCSNVTYEDAMGWVEKTCRNSFAKIALTYSLDKSAFIASITVDGIGKGDPRRCTTMFGKSALSAIGKLLYLVEYLRWDEKSELEVDTAIEAAELEIKSRFKRNK